MFGNSSELFTTLADLYANVNSYYSENAIDSNSSVQTFAGISFHFSNKEIETILLHKGITDVKEED